MPLTTHQRTSLYALACSTALTLSSPANALDWYHKLLSGNNVPDWAIGNSGCQATLILPRVAVTAGQCSAGPGAQGFYHRKTSRLYTGEMVTYPERFSPLGDVAVFITSSNFGGSNIATADIASYRVEKERFGEWSPQLVIYGADSAYDRFINSARVATHFHGYVPINGSLHRWDNKPLTYRSIPFYRQTEPERLLGLRISDLLNIFTADQASLIYTHPDGLLLTDQDVDSAVIATAPPLNIPGEAHYSPVDVKDTGAGLFVRLPNGQDNLVGTISSGAAHVRLSTYWPWIVKTLLSKGMRNDAILLSQKVLGTGQWGSNDRRGSIGQIFVYDNPYNRKIEYFRLVTLGGDGRYWYFPINEKDNEHWEYLGNTLPNIEQATTPLHTWGTRDRRGTVGSIYVYNNPYSRQVEYFRLARLGGDARYWYFPINQKDDYYWQYLGTDLPTSPMTFVERLN